MSIKKTMFLLCCCLCIQGMAQPLAKVVDTERKVTRIDFTETFEDGTLGEGVLSYHSTSDNQSTKRRWLYHRNGQCT